MEGFTNYIAGRIADKDEIRKARIFPYQLMVAYGQASDSVPAEVIRALEDAMEIALSNLPKIAGNVVVCPDVFGSMASSVTGYRKGASSKVRCIDVAALTAAAILRKILWPGSCPSPLTW